MKADLLVRGISEMVSARGAGLRRGAAMREVVCVEDAALAVSGGRFAWVGRAADWAGEARETVDVGGRAVVPGLVDPHTHAVWAGDRMGDFDRRTSGMTYEEILAAGGGIRSTIRATAAASVDDLVELALPRLRALVRTGATVIEVKSGYGFEPAAEVRMLEAVRILQGLVGARLVPTLLIHIPPVKESERAGYLARVTGELIPEVAQRGLARAVDVFVEREAWTAAEAKVVLRCAVEHGLGVKVHAEQFHRVGGLEMAVGMGAMSVDHMEAASSEQFGLMAGSGTVATLLPGVSLHLGIACADGRGLIDAGAAVAVGTDLNPGSSPLYSMAAALGLAVRLNGLTAAEALVAGTVNAAAALRIEDAGRIEVGMPADFAVLEGADWRELVYAMGVNPVREVWAAGVRA